MRPRSVIVDSDNVSTAQSRWGEGVILCAALPGLIAAAILAFGLISERLGWQPRLGPGTIVLAFVAMSSPLLVVLGTLSLIAGTLALRHVPGRSRHKWAILIIGILAWAVAGYWLSVPGLIELP
jgi:hypothetical protein